MARILQILGSLGRGGAETMVMNYYRELSSKGFQFDFVVHAEAVNGYEEEAQAMGAKLIRLPQPGQIGAYKYIRMLKKEISKNGPYDVVHTHTDVQCFLGAIAARLAGVPRVITHSHTTRFTKKKALINRVVLRLLGTVSLACGEAAGKAFYGKSDFDIVQNAMCIEKYACVSGEEIAAEKKRLGMEGKFIISHVGRFMTPKNHRFIVRMMAPILKENENTVLCFAGGGELMEEIRALCGELGIADRVKFLGVVNNTHVVYNLSDIVILPSLYEGLPLTVIEAQAAGRVMLCSEKVTRECDMNLGLVEFIPLDESRWRERITQYIKKEVIPVSRSLVERKRSLESYDILQQGEKLMKIYGVLQ